MKIIINELNVNSIVFDYLNILGYEKSMEIHLRCTTFVVSINKWTPLKGNFRSPVINFKNRSPLISFKIKFLIHVETSWCLWCGNCCH